MIGAVWTSMHGRTWGVDDAVIGFHADGPGWCGSSGSGTLFVVGGRHRLGGRKVRVRVSANN